jgi:hypothetical protein
MKHPYKKVDTQGDDYTLCAVWFCVLTLPEEQDFPVRGSRPAVMKIRPLITSNLRFRSIAPMHKIMPKGGYVLCLVIVLHTNKI